MVGVPVRAAGCAMAPAVPRAATAAGAGRSTRRPTRSRRNPPPACGPPDDRRPAGRPPAARAAGAPGPAPGSGAPGRAPSHVAPACLPAPGDAGAGRAYRLQAASPGMPTGSEPRVPAYPPVRATGPVPIGPAPRRRHPSLVRTGRPGAARRPRAQAHRDQTGPGSGWAGTSGPGGSNDHPPPSGRRVIDGPAVNASTDTASSRLRTRSSTRCGPVHDDRQDEPVAERVRHRAQEVPGTAVRAEDDLAGAGRSPARGPGMQQRQGGADDLGVLRADQFQVRGPGGRVRRGGGPGVEHHAAVDVDQGCGDDPHVTQQWSEHDGDAVGPDVHHVAVASHERAPQPAPATRGRSAVTGASTGRTPGCHRGRSGPPSGCP